MPLESTKIAAASTVDCFLIVFPLGVTPRGNVWQQGTFRAGRGPEQVTYFSQWTAAQAGAVKKARHFAAPECALGRVNHRCTCLRTKSAEGGTEIAAASRLAIKPEPLAAKCEDDEDWGR
jgi:hypothetical protein